MQADDTDALAHLAARPPAAWRAVPTGRADRLYSVTWDDDFACYVLSVGSVRIGRATTLDGALDALEVDARHFVAEFARGSVFIHAGTVAVEGRAVVIPGRSGTGKSTLVAALVGRGAIYYSDEYAVFDDRGQVHSYLKPLYLRSEGRGKAAADINALTTGPRPPVPLGAVIHGPFAGPETTWQPIVEPAGPGMMALLDNAVAVRRQPETTLVYLQRAMLDVVVLVGPRGDADSTAEALLRRLRELWA